MVRKLEEKELLELLGWKTARFGQIEAMAKEIILWRKFGLAVIEWVETEQIDKGADLLNKMAEILEGK